MAARYSVIQYIPDPVTDERVNVGVVAFFENQVATRFLTNWQRVRNLFGKDAAVPDRVEELFRGINVGRLHQMIEESSGSIRLTRPNASLRSVEQTLEDAVCRFLTDPPFQITDSRSHADVVTFAKFQLSAAVAQTLGSRAAKAAIRQKVEVPGRFGVSRPFDLAIQNGKVLHLLQGLSFQGKRTYERRVEATAFLAEEVKDRIPFTVIVAPPKAEGAAYDNATRTLRAVGATVVTETEFEPVAHQLAFAFKEHVYPKSGPSIGVRLTDEG